MPTIGWFKPQAARRAEELRVTEAEHAAVARVEPVALARRRRREPEDRRVQPHAAGRAVELRVAEAEHAAVAGDEPVAVPARRRRHADDRLVELLGRRSSRGTARRRTRTRRRRRRTASSPDRVGRRARRRGSALASAAAGRAARVGQVAERDQLTGARRDPVAGAARPPAAPPTCDPEQRQHRLDGVARARGRVGVAVTADVVRGA